MPCHLYRGACHVFLWSMWWLEWACKVAFVILLFSGTLYFAKSLRIVIMHASCEWCIFVHVHPMVVYDIWNCSSQSAIHLILLWNACLSSSWCPNHWCKSAIKCLLLLLSRLWWFVIFATFDVCFIWAWALHVFWSMPCHLYKGACLVFLWCLWWLAQACKVAFVILLISGT